MLGRIGWEAGVVFSALNEPAREARLRFRLDYLLKYVPGALTKIGSVAQA
ncbi:MAG TPA: hypothetical protein VN661_08810 [Candidatus Acidoferrales bacterium]|nr:hypothetical protein [Candidatus Acidoferrales bacterium]